MSYQGIENLTDFKVEPYLLADEEGRDCFVVMVKATYQIYGNGALSIAPEQKELIPEGQYWGEPGQSSIKYAPESCFTKNATDVVLIGHAHAPQGRQVTQLDVGLRVGNLSKIARVIGDRYWVRQQGILGNRWQQTEVQPFSKMPLVYERAFGGQDLSPDDEKDHVYEARNLVGTGMIAKNSKLTQVRMPNIEDIEQPIKSISDRPAPTGFGAISPDWQPRLTYAGTCDEAWQQDRMPLLPSDFDRRYFNFASPGLVAQGFLKGHEEIDLLNLTPNGRLRTYLPGHQPIVLFSFDYEEEKRLSTMLDAVIINSDDLTLTLLWRACQNVYNRIYAINKVVVKHGHLQLNQAVA
ncbi:MAG: DUF2169 domain-containing protein [Gammaproteobacteria bacterium]|nr:DUF2169 domain-containing protein [Gammaproteobacteria bacterium]MDH5651313.1 DUF2169 domain-containing protein [Gammaproteobacteria bacterium]